MLLISTRVWPNPTGNGSSVLMNGLLEASLLLGFRPTVVPIFTNSSPKEDKEFQAALESRGIRVEYIPELLKVRSPNKLVRIQRGLIPTNSNLIPSRKTYCDQLNKIAQKNGHSVAIGYDWESLGLLGGLENAYRVASLVDLFEDHIDHRAATLAQSPPYKNVLKRVSLFNYKRSARLGHAHLAKADLIIEHAAHHADDLRNLGFKNIRVIGNPIASPSPTELARAKQHANPNSDDITVLILGSFKGKASQLGFEFFLNKVWPQWEKQPKEITSRFCFRVVGHGEMPATIRERLEALPRVEIVGFAPDIVAEYQRSDFMLVNVPVKTGFRTRIAEAFSYEQCVVAHSANCSGMPEVIDGKNAMVSDDPEGICERIIQAGTNSALRDKIASSAKTTFENCYSHLAAAKRLEEWLPNEYLPSREAGSKTAQGSSI